MKANGGTVIGSSKHPINSSDFSSNLLQAQASKAQVLGLANAGYDLINSIKQPSEFGVNKTVHMAPLKSMKINDLFATGAKFVWMAEWCTICISPGSNRPPKYPWDHLKLEEKVPGEEAFTIPAESKCAVWK